MARRGSRQQRDRGARTDGPPRRWTPPPSSGRSPTASAALARLDARLAAAPPDVADGLRARLALREAAGWLAHQHGAWVHPTDLGLREAGLTGSLTAAAMSGRLRAALPATLAPAPAPRRRSAGGRRGGGPRRPGTGRAGLAEDRAVADALRLGRLWRRLAEQRGWAPLADADTLRQLLAQLGGPAPAEEALADWLGRFAGGTVAPAPVGRAGVPTRRARRSPPCCGRGRRPRRGRRGSAGAGQGGPAVDRRAVPRRRRLAPRRGRTIRRQWPGHRAAALVGDAAAPGAPGPGRRAGLAGRLPHHGDRRRAARRPGTHPPADRGGAGAALRRTARSHLPAAAELALRPPVLTARGLAERLRLSPQAALGLLNQLVAAGVLRKPPVGRLAGLRGRLMEARGTGLSARRCAAAGSAPPRI